MAPAAAIEAPLTDVTDVIGELRSVSYLRPDGTRSFAVVAEDFAKYFPAAVAQTPDGPTIESNAATAVLLSLVKEVHAANAHLNSQMEHFMNDKAELERRLYGLEAELEELRAERLARGSLAARSRSRRGRGASARQ